MPEQTKEEYIQHLGEIMKLWTVFEASDNGWYSLPPSLKRNYSKSTHSIIEAPGTVIVHVRIPNIQIRHHGPNPMLNT